MPVPTDTGGIRSPVGIVHLVLRIVRVWSLRYMFGMGVMIGLLGYSWIVQPSATREAGIEWIDAIDPWMIGVVWLLAGLCAVVAALMRRPLVHRVGWFGLIAIPAITALYFTVSWIIWLTPIDGGNSRGWITAASYGAFAISYCVSRIHAEIEEISQAWGDE